MFNSTFRFLGRLLVTIILFTAAYEKLQYPQMFKTGFNKSLGHIQDFGTTNGIPLPDLKSHVTLFIRLSGILDAFTGLILLFGDSKRLGGQLMLTRFIVGFMSYYLPWSSHCLKSFSQRERFANNIGLLGVALLLYRHN